MSAPPRAGTTTAIHLTLFGPLASLTGSRTRTIELKEDRPTVATLRSALILECPELKDHLDHVAVAVETEIVQDSTPLEAEARVSLLPPVSGG